MNSRTDPSPIARGQFNLGRERQDVSIAWYVWISLPEAKLGVSLDSIAVCGIPSRPYKVILPLAAHILLSLGTDFLWELIEKEKGTKTSSVFCF